VRMCMRVCVCLYACAYPPTVFETPINFNFMKGITTVMVQLYCEKHCI